MGDVFNKLMSGLVLFVVVCLICLFVNYACQSPDTARKILEQNGYKDIQTGGYGWFACSESDTFSTKFTAVNPSGKTVSGVVCSGLTKKSTIRFD